MKSTGEVYGSDIRADVAYLKARLATEIPVAAKGGVYLTVRDEDKEGLVPIANELAELGFTIYATPGTADVIRARGVEVQTVYRITDRKHPDALDLMRTDQVSFIVNVPTISGGAVRDGNMMRRLAVEMNIPFVTTMSGAKMEVSAIRAMREVDLQPMRLKVNY
jgi:carbamoyl-phosphate synthase large subunit